MTIRQQYARMMMVVLYGAASLGLGGCLWLDYDEVEAGAPITFFEKENYPRATGLGRVLTAYQNGASSRVAAGAGPGSPHLVFDVWSGDQLGESAAIFDGCDDGCEEGIGADIASIGNWEDGTGCILVSAVLQGNPMTQGVLRVHCESSSQQMRLLTPIANIDFGRSLASLSTGWGVAVIGAPEDGPGGMYILAQDQSLATALALPSTLDLPADARLGTDVETFAVGDMPDRGLTDAAVILAAAPGQERVIALLVGQGADGLHVETLGCMDGFDIRSPADTFTSGGAIALVDLDADGSPEAILGDPENDRIMIVPVAGLTQAAGCDSTAVEEHPGAIEIGCADLPADGRVQCSRFGASIASGDFDGDGDVDLVIGAPASTVAGVVGAGAIYILPTEDGALNLVMSRANTLSSTEENAFLGERVVVGRTNLNAEGRDQPIASAPGANRIYSFYCTGLVGDVPVDNDRCL